MKETDHNIITGIARARARNNELWMGILEIALANSPTETKSLLRSISDNDQAILTMLKEMLA